MCTSSTLYFFSLNPVSEMRWWWWGGGYLLSSSTVRGLLCKGADSQRSTRLGPSLDQEHIWKMGGQEVGFKAIICIKWFKSDIGFISTTELPATFSLAINVWVLTLLWTLLIIIQKAQRFICPGLSLVHLDLLCVNYRHILWNTNYSLQFPGLGSCGAASDLPNLKKYGKLDPSMCVVASKLWQI